MFPPLFIHLNLTESTMLEAESIMNKIDPSPEQFLVIADAQSNGKGRNQNIWHSPSGGLWFSYCVKSSIVSHQVTLLLGLLLRDTLAKQYPDLESSLRIKWPNDLMLNDKKMAGILVKYLQGYLIIGIGINTNNAVPDLSGPWKPINLKDLLSFPVSHIGLLTNLLSAFTMESVSYFHTGIKAHQDRINQNLFGRDKIMEFDTDSEVLTGICRGISEEGALELEKETGELLSFYAGSVINIIS